MGITLTEDMFTPGLAVQQGLVGMYCETIKKSSNIEKIWVKNFFLM